MAIKINADGKVAVRVVIDTVLTEDQIITAVAHTTHEYPEMGDGKYQRGSENWPKKAQIIEMLDTAVENGDENTAIGDLSDDDARKAWEDAERRARNIIMRSYPDLLMG